LSVFKGTLDQQKSCFVFQPTFISKLMTNSKLILTFISDSFYTIKGNETVIYPPSFFPKNTDKRFKLMGMTENQFTSLNEKADSSSSWIGMSLWAI